MSLGCTEDEAIETFQKAQLHFPVLAKPFFTDGRQGSHGLALIDCMEGLKKLVNGTGPPGVTLPVMLQPFIEHKGCLFKVHILWPAVQTWPGLLVDSLSFTQCVDLLFGQYAENHRGTMCLIASAVPFCYAQASPKREASSVCGAKQ